MRLVFIGVGIDESWLAAGFFEALGCHVMAPAAFEAKFNAPDGAAATAQGGVLGGSPALAALDRLVGWLLLLTISLEVLLEVGAGTWRESV